MVPKMNDNKYYFAKIEQNKGDNNKLKEKRVATNEEDCQALGNPGWTFQDWKSIELEPWNLL